MCPAKNSQSNGRDTQAVTYTTTGAITMRDKGGKTDGKSAAQKKHISGKENMRKGNESMKEHEELNILSSRNKIR